MAPPNDYYSPLTFTQGISEQVPIRHSGEGRTKIASRIERPQGGPEGERSESSRKTSKLDPGLRRGDDLFRIHLIPYPSLDSLAIIL